MQKVTIGQIKRITIFALKNNSAQDFVVAFFLGA
jgi:hypothetical protein